MNGMQGSRRLGEIMASGGEGLGALEKPVFDAMKSLGNAGSQDAEREILQAVDACLGYFSPLEQKQFGQPARKELTQAQITDMALVCQQIHPELLRAFLLKTKGEIIRHGIPMSELAREGIQGRIDSFRGAEGQRFREHEMHLRTVQQPLAPRAEANQPIGVPHARAPQPEFRAPQETARLSGWQRLARLFRFRRK